MADLRDRNDVYVITKVRDDDDEAAARAALQPLALDPRVRAVALGRQPRRVALT